MKWIAALALLFANTTYAASVAVTGDAIAVATAGEVALYDAHLSRLWSARGVDFPGPIASSTGAVAIADPVRNEVAIVDTRARSVSRVATGETPVAVAFAGGHVLVLARDAAQLDIIDPAGKRRSIATGRDAALLAASESVAWIVARGDGTLQRIDVSNARVERVTTVPPFASDLECDGTTVYVSYPRDGLVRAYDAVTLAAEGEIKVGAVPVDIALGRGTALTARTLSIADPAAKRVWISEGRQSLAQAFARGFLRGLIGLNLYGARSREFPTGVDRVVTAGKHTLAYDSSTGALCAVEKKRVKVIADALGTTDFAATPDGIVYWQISELHLAKW